MGDYDNKVYVTVASTGSDTKIDGHADTAASTSVSTSKDQSSSSTVSSSMKIRNSTGAAGALVTSGKGAGICWFKDIAILTSDVHANWAYD